MSTESFNLNFIPHFQFTSYLSHKTLGLLKEQVRRFMRDQMDLPLLEPFLDWKLKPNEIFLYATYSLLEFDLPKDFDVFFWQGNKNLVDAPVHIPFAIIDGIAPGETVSRGHKHVCLLQFQGPVPDIIKELPEVNGPFSSSSDLILSKRTDLFSK
jgi:hypothetical protein